MSSQGTGKAPRAELPLPHSEAEHRGRTREMAARGTPRGFGIRRSQGKWVPGSRAFPKDDRHSSASDHPPQATSTPVYSSLLPVCVGTARVSVGHTSRRTGAGLAVTPQASAHADAPGAAPRASPHPPRRPSPHAPTQLAGTWLVMDVAQGPTLGCDVAQVDGLVNDLNLPVGEGKRP